MLLPLIKSNDENIGTTIERLFNAEPFNGFPTIKEALLKEHKND